MPVNDFGRFFKSLREEKGLTINQLATLSGVSSSYISRIENNDNRRPHPDILRKVSPHLGIGLNDLLLHIGYLNTEEAMYVDDEEIKRILSNLTPERIKLLKSIQKVSDEQLENLTCFIVGLLNFQKCQEATPSVEESSDGDTEE